VNSHGSKILSTVLVVVHKKVLEKFRELYPMVLLNWYEADFENWKTRTMANCNHSNQNIEDDAVREEAVQADFNALKAKHVKMMRLPGVVPGSDKFLGHEDNDGNQLFRVTVMKDMVYDFLRILKKNGFTCQEFNYDGDQYVANKNLEAQLRQEMRTCNERLLNKSNHNFQELF